MRVRPNPIRLSPNSASMLGSGTVVAGVNTARMIMSSWLSSGPAPESSQNSQAARLAKRNRTDFYKLLARHQLTPEDFKQR